MAAGRNAAVVSCLHLISTILSQPSISLLVLCLQTGQHGLDLSLPRRLTDRLNWKLFLVCHGGPGDRGISSGHCHPCQFCSRTGSRRLGGERSARVGCACA